MEHGEHRTQITESSRCQKKSEVRSQIRRSRIRRSGHGGGVLVLVMVGGG